MSLNADGVRNGAFGFHSSVTGSSETVTGNVLRSTIVLRRFGIVPNSFGIVLNSFVRRSSWDLRSSWKSLFVMGNRSQLSLECWTAGSFAWVSLVKVLLAVKPRYLAARHASS